MAGFMASLRHSAVSGERRGRLGDLMLALGEAPVGGLEPLAAEHVCVDVATLLM